MCAKGGSDTPEDDTATFSRALETLKERGSNLLLVGANHETIQSQACQRFLGDSIAEPRRRLFVYTDSDGTVDGQPMESLYAHAGADATKVIERPTPTRSAAATGTSAPSPSSIPRITVEDGSLADFGDVIVRSILEFDRVSGGLDPAELRLCFDSLLPLLAEHDREEVFRFLHLVIASVREANGMAHYHLPIERDSDAVELLAPLFDAVIEVRVHDGVPQQRWYLAREDFTTEWLSL